MFVAIFTICVGVALYCTTGWSSQDEDFIRKLLKERK